MADNRFTERKYGAVFTLFVITMYGQNLVLMYAISLATNLKQTINEAVGAKTMG